MATSRSLSDTSAEANPQLKKALNGWQIFFIAVSALIGTGIFSHDGLALSVAGPGALVLATCIVGVITICFMDGLSEMIQIFPCANALVEYVRAFVDDDLAVCVGFAYWAVWAMSFSLQLGAAADFLSVWTLKDPQEDLWARLTIWFLVAPIILVLINVLPVYFFGWIETVGGCFKMLMIIALSYVLYFLAGINEGLQAQTTLPVDDSYFDDGHHGFTESGNFPNAWANAFSVLTLVSFSWIGNEIVAVTAFEAHDLKDLRLPSQALPYVTFFVYLVAAVGSSLAVDYNNIDVSTVYREATSKDTTTEPPLEALSPLNSSSSLIVIAANEVGQFTMAAVFNVFLILSALSEANTSLYIASRTIYGLAFRDEDHQWKIYKWHARNWFAQVNRWKVPWFAILISAVSFIWLPIISVRDIPDATTPDITSRPRAIDSGSQQWLNTATCQCALFVWAVECFAFIRYYYQLREHRGDPDQTQSYRGTHNAKLPSDQKVKGFGVLEEQFPKLNRWGTRFVGWTLLGCFQPIPAMMGFGGCVCLLTVFPIVYLAGDLSSTSGGSGASTAYQVTQYFLAPAVICLLWVALKLLKKGKQREETDSWTATKGLLNNLIRLSKEGSRHSSLGNTVDQATQTEPQSDRNERTVQIHVSEASSATDT